MVASKGTECFANEPDQIGFERGDAWLRADIVGRHVVIDKFDDVPLDAGCCRKLAAWLNRAAERMGGEQTHTRRRL